MKTAIASTRKKVTGYIAGALAGAFYGLNPLFAKPLMEGGMNVTAMLFFRYFISACLLGILILVRREHLGAERKQVPQLVLLGVMFACSSIFLFASYKFIPSGLATTLVYIYPVFVALILIAMRIYPSWQTWLSIAATFGGIILLSSPSDGEGIRLTGLILAIASALSYAGYLVIVNRSRKLRSISEHTLTFHVLVWGSAAFAALRLLEGGSFIRGINSWNSVVNLLGLAIFPTMISLLALAVSTRYIGPTKTSVLGVFEPLTALFVGVAVFDEPFTLQMLAGVAICIAGVIFMIAKPGKK